MGSPETPEVGNDELYGSREAADGTTQSIDDVAKQYAAHYKTETTKLLADVKEVADSMIFTAHPQDKEDALQKEADALEASLTGTIQEIEGKQVVNAKDFEEKLRKVEDAIEEIESWLEDKGQNFASYSERMEEYWAEQMEHAGGITVESWMTSGKKRYAIDIPEGWGLTGFTVLETRDVSMSRKRVIFEEIPEGATVNTGERLLNLLLNEDGSKPVLAMENQPLTKAEEEAIGLDLPAEDASEDEIKKALEKREQEREKRKEWAKNLVKNAQDQKADILKTIKENKELIEKLLPVEADSIDATISLEVVEIEIEGPDGEMVKEQVEVPHAEVTAKIKGVDVTLPIDVIPAEDGAFVNVDVVKTVTPVIERIKTIVASVEKAEAEAEKEELTDVEKTGVQFLEDNVRRAMDTIGPAPKGRGAVALIPVVDMQNAEAKLKGAIATKSADLTTINIWLRSTGWYLTPAMKLSSLSLRAANEVSNREKELEAARAKRAKEQLVLEQKAELALKQMLHSIEVSTQGAKHDAKIAEKELKKWGNWAVWNNLRKRIAVGERYAAEMQNHRKELLRTWYKQPGPGAKLAIVDVVTESRINIRNRASANFRKLSKELQIIERNLKYTEGALLVADQAVGMAAGFIAGPAGSIVYSLTSNATKAATGYISKEEAVLSVAISIPLALIGPSNKALDKMKFKDALMKSAKGRELVTAVRDGVGLFFRRDLSEAAAKKGIQEFVAALADDQIHARLIDAAKLVGIVPKDKNVT